MSGEGVSVYVDMCEGKAHSSSGDLAGLRFGEEGGVARSDDHAQLVANIEHVRELAFTSFVLEP